VTRGTPAGLGFADGGGRAQELSFPVVPGADTSQESVQFIGTATMLIRHAGITILTDPNFLHAGEHVHVGYGITGTRLTDPAIELDALPPIDFVLLSHMHEDHFDRKVEARLDKRIPIVTTPHAARTLVRRGFRNARALRTWDGIRVRKGDATLAVTAMPGRHGPPLVAAALPRVMGSLITIPRADGTPYRIYVSGDTLVYRDIGAIARREPHVDLAFLHLGGTRVLGILVTMDAAQGVRMLQILRPRTAIPIHYDDYDLFKSPLDDFRAAVRAAGLESTVRYLARGDVYDLRPVLGRRRAHSEAPASARRSQAE
jgi:L-ascorbate metabolism protein UlaG (beta-lactamase superfamily)